MTEQVCALDGVRVAESRSGRLVHTEDLPKGADPDHEIHAVPFAEFLAAASEAFSLKAAAEDMMAHHATLCPTSGCAWAARLATALKSA